VKQLATLAVGDFLAALSFDDVDGAVGEEQIEPAVVVVVDPACAKPGHGGRGGAKTGLRARASSKLPVPVVQVEHVRLADDVRDEEVLVAVVVASPSAIAMLPSGRPSRLNAVPESRPRSSNVPSCG
jgi:hypothetical protein